MKVLANDGISKSGIKALEKGGFEVITTKVAQEQVANYINTNGRMGHQGFYQFNAFGIQLPAVASSH